MSSLSPAYHSEHSAAQVEAKLNDSDGEDAGKEHSDQQSKDLNPNRKNTPRLGRQPRYYA
jgi:hypothetical protein